jgi:integrase
MRTNAEGENYCMYSFRHSYATWKIEAGVPIKQLADVMGNSVAIIEKHYSHALTANFKENFI